jgi:hypothetical protein
MWLKRCSLLKWIAIWESRWFTITFWGQSPRLPKLCHPNAKVPSKPKHWNNFRDRGKNSRNQGRLSPQSLWSKFPSVFRVRGVYPPRKLYASPPFPILPFRHPPVLSLLSLLVQSSPLPSPTLTSRPLLYFINGVRGYKPRKIFWIYRCTQVSLAHFGQNYQHCDGTRFSRGIFKSQ